MIINQADINKSFNNFSNTYSKDQLKQSIKKIIDMDQKYKRYNKTNRTLYLTRKTNNPNEQYEMYNEYWKESIDINQYQQIKRDKNIKRVEEKLLTFKYIDNELYKLIKDFCDMYEYRVQDIITQLKKRDKDLIKGLLIWNKYDLLELEKPVQYEEYIEQEMPKVVIERDDYKILTINEIIDYLYQVLLKIRIDVTQDIVIKYYKIIEQTQKYIKGSNLITFPKLYKVISSINNHQMNKLNNQQIKLFCEKIINNITQN